MPRILSAFAALLALMATAPASAQTGAQTGATTPTPAAPAASGVDSQPAPEPVSEAIRSKIRQWTGGRFEVEEIRTTPLPDLFEVRIRTDLFYVDRSARFILVEGEMVEMDTNRNLTRERKEQLMAIRFDDLPVAKAIKQVNGRGSRVVALFEDPNCGFCKRLRADLMALDDLTIYTFAYPILAADSDVKSRKALCAKDPSTAWNQLMLTGQVPDNDGKCDTSIAEFKTLGERFGISATPTVFFPSGFRLEGYAPPTRFVELLDQNQGKPAS